MTKESPLETAVANGAVLESLYETYLNSPEKLDQNWRSLFGSLDSGIAERFVSAGSPLSDLLRVHQLIENYKRMAISLPLWTCRFTWKRSSRGVISTSLRIY